MKRKITQQLIDWKNRSDHKPLILQGARQVGKTYILEEFGRQHYKNYIKVSLDLVTDVRNFLKDNINPLEIIAYLETLYNVRIVPHDTLVILDEIQDCKRALLALKYFQEDYPQYDVVAAGSLLGVAVNQGNKPDQEETQEKQEEEFSYPVGKVDELRLYPMDFEEFLWAMNMDVLAEDIRTHFNSNEAMPASVHQLALDYYQRYLIIGGMPESVGKYVETHSYLECRTVQQSILNGYNADMAKYAKPGTTVKIRACFNSIPAQLAKENRKFQYKLAQKGGTAKIFGEAIEWLILAGIVHKCKLISHGFIPISTQEDDSDFKIYMSDIGLLNTKAQMPAQMLLNSIETDNTFLGSVAENYVAQALSANGITLRYWKNDNTQEVEYILQDGMSVIPLEVKKGRKVDAISMNNFKKTYKCPFAYRISGKNFGMANDIKSVPLYAVFCIEARE
ncbi:MAG: ATP-binding protein [Bacteroidaceae bacterium]|nr:ATP-binding protein [Bacteroidaceae bacterium]